MGKRKARQSEITQETLIYSNHDETRSDELEDGEKSGFFACYLLTSLCPRYKGHTYIGFTVNPRRRIRQHNGEICSGATRTKKKRPWEMVLCIHGFHTNVAALQFEWAWQHPVESLAVRKAAVGFKSLGGLANKIKLAYTMLTLPAWNNLNLTVNFFSMKYTKYYAGCPTLPCHMRVQIRSMDELPCYTEGYKEDEDDIFKFENDMFDNDVEEEERENTGGSRCFLEVQIEDVTIPVLASVDHHNNEEKVKEAISVSDNGNDEQPLFSNIRSMDDVPCYEDDMFKYENNLWDDEEELGKTYGSQNLEVHNEEEKAICVSDTEKDEQPVFSNIRSMDELPCYEDDMFKYENNSWDDEEEPVKTYGSHSFEVRIGEEAICVSDTENHERSLFVNIPERSYLDSHYDFSGVSPLMEDKNGKMDKGGPETKISVSSGPIEVIDVFSPSPEYRINARKKKRGGSVCPEIIDLTQSPVCV